MTSTIDGARGAVAVHAGQDGLVRVVLSGAVDSTVAQVFAVTCRQALGQRPARLELDLSAMEEVGTAGVSAIAWCLSMRNRLAGGMGVSVATPAGRRALLDATVRM